MSFFQGFDNVKHIADIFEDRSILDYDFLIAVNEQYDYEGSAYLLATKDGKLFEVEAGHCSCYGFENQWEPAEVTVEYLLNRVQKGRLGLGYVDETMLRLLLVDFLSA